LSRPARLAASIIVAILAILVFHHAVLIPYRLNLAIRRVKLRSLTAIKYDTVTSRRMSIENAAVMAGLMTPISMNAESLMVRALNYRLHGKMHEALADYHRANELEERPEIHFQLARLYLELGDLAAHEKHRMEATDFHRSYSE
jgi:tetratricopeptide (TPR) repeat protein